MTTILDLIQSGRIIDIILCLVALEGLALIGLHKATGRGPEPLRLVANLAAGSSLLLALKAALAGAGAPLIAALLLLSLILHVWDLAMRWS